ncbi:RAMP superfamily CRISPR-associated protein [Acidianus manzaensis]|uniref:CRISPR type III-associated protein domain-containing protein n=1 Tax=Acidianus manzaensis TaxID=282676 RepID=A0A1W6JWG6_9CREN|nr:RAMP superfamily CRISPR-associated protein [Acidianus manzaensis]ARM74589.1 hypothetical protein B6F84_00125 [Acidianus manzaensis]
MSTKYLITLKVNNLRGHVQSGNEENYNADLKALYLKVGDKIYVLPGSSLKGLIRRNMKILGLGNSAVSILGSEFKQESKMGKVVIGWGYINQERNRVFRHGIKVNEELGIVEKGALYLYEMLPGQLDVSFEVISLSTLSEDELKGLAKAINLMKFSTIGWGGSKGLGIVEEVKLDDKLVSILNKK